MRANVYGTPYEYGIPLSNYDMFQTMAAQVLLRESCSLADTRVYARAHTHTHSHTYSHSHIETLSLTYTHTGCYG